MQSNLKFLVLALLALLLAAVGGCASFAPGTLQPGTPIATARGIFGGPTAEYPLASGGTRLEFRQGSFGKQTWMLDFNAGGTLVASRQVLTEADFAKIVPGMTREDVLMRIGHPADIFGVPWQKLHVWNYRYFDGDCVWFQVSISDAGGHVTEAGMGQDPACDVGGSGRD